MSNVLKAGQVIRNNELTASSKSTQVAVEKLDHDLQHPSGERDLDELLAGSQIIRQARLEILSQMERMETIALMRAQTIAQEEASYHARYEKAVRDGEAEGFKAGYELGLAEGRQEGLETFETLTQTVENARRQLQEREAQLLDQFQKDIAILAVALAEKLVARSLELDDATTLAILNSLLPQAEGSTKTIINLPTQTYEAFHDEISMIHAKERDSVGGVTFVADPSLRQGDVMIQTDWGLIDGRLKSRWQRILEGLDLRGEIQDEGS